ncbi:uncharacterized protein SOCE26_021410 [Sorangium cellulosum]|uniref:Uncharacterized protein n=1 Tax=Sorangium cellulosum TaxID=56 RepID=A0A2L0EN82_SORCE|nr:hypothetical protein [Sorangium cellulosum]AUX40740.1 uncharacterized protein SOCE26_021410 [Sorangium cellulosum]
MKSKRGKGRAKPGVEAEKPGKAERRGAAEVSWAGERAQVEQLLRLRRPLTDVQRTAFRSRFSDVQCDELGGRAKSGPVFREGLEWAARIQKTLDQPHEGLRYSEERFTWLLECLLELAKARASYKSAQDPAGTARRLGEQARAASLELREELATLLAELAGGVEAEVEALAKAQGTGADARELAASLRALAGLAEDWLRRGSDVDRALVASAGLTQAHAQAAWRAADELERVAGDGAQAAGDGAQTAGDGAADEAGKRDATAVVRAEGRLLREMAVAMRSFSEARRKNKLIRKLVPGSATRDVLKPRAARSSEPEAQAPQPEETPDAQPAPDQAPYHAALNGQATT